MKKIVAMLLMLVMVLSLTAVASAEAKYTIAYCTREPADDAGQNMIEQGIRSVVDANADFELWMLTVDSINDVSEQANTIEEAVAAKVDAIIVNPNDGTTCLEAIKTATDAGIPVVIVDGRLDDGYEDYYVTQVGADNAQAGTSAAEMMLELAPDGGNYVVVRGVNGSVVLDTRSDCLNAALEGSNWVCVGDMNNETSDNEGAMTVTENMLAAASYDVDVVFAAADAWFPGIAQALEDADLFDAIKLVGIDASTTGLPYYQEGHVLAEVQVRLDLVAQTAAQICVDIVTGAKTADDYEPVTNVATDKVYEADIEEALKVAF